MHLLGNHKVVRLGPLRLWAERGLIHVEDASDNSYKTESVEEMLYRAKALNDMKIKFDGTESKAERKTIIEERERIQRLVEEILEIARIAREQGTPEDPTAAHDIAARRPKSFVMPSTVDMERIQGLFS